MKFRYLGILDFWTFSFRYLGILDTWTFRYFLKEGGFLENL